MISKNSLNGGLARIWGLPGFEKVLRVSKDCSHRQEVTDRCIATDSQLCLTSVSDQLSPDWYFYGKPFDKKNERKNG